MPIPKNINIFQNFYRSKYFKVPTQLKGEKTQTVTTLILTLIAFSFLGFFAISPTLSTITELQKQLEDYNFVENQLNQKITNLSILQQKYNLLQKDLPVIMSAIPQNPTAPFLFGQIQNIAKDSNVSLIRIQSSSIELSKQIEGADKYSSFNFSLEVEGSYKNMLIFLSSLSNYERILILDSISVNKNSEKKEGLRLNIRGKTLFKK